MASVLEFDAFSAAPGPILDVRSPGEYHQAHIPGAVNLPLFSDRERAAVGTCYQQQGREAAVELGLGFVGPKLADFVQQAKGLTAELGGGRSLRLHCWRGGMRSSSMAWLMETAGFESVLLVGGYKAFRGWVRRVLAEPRSLLILGGMTGTGKTEILQALQAQGEQVLDLEGLANHRGSSYGNLGLPPQPSTEQYENLIAWTWQHFSPERPIWIEAESAQVGRCRIPPEIWQQMGRSPIWEIQRSLGERIQLLAQLYGEAGGEALIVATERIRKRLGPQRTQAAIDWIRQGRLEPAIAIVLDYYDRTYRYDLARRSEPLRSLDISKLSPQAAAQRLLDELQRTSA